jgi:hypothetical protein
MNLVRMIALMLVIGSVAACRPPVVEEVEVPVEAVEDQITDAVTDAEAVDSVDTADVELEIVEEVR